MTEENGGSEGDIRVYYSEGEGKWVCEFTTILPSGKEVPRAMKCDTKDELIRRMSMVRIGRVNRDT